MKMAVTSFVWPDAQAPQVANYLNRAALEFWGTHLGYPVDPISAQGAPITVQCFAFDSKNFLLPESEGPNYESALTAIQPLTLYCEQKYDKWWDFCELHDYCLEADAIYHEFAHVVLSMRVSELLVGANPSLIRVDNSDIEGAAIDEALADYFAATFTADPIIDDCKSCI